MRQDNSGNLFVGLITVIVILACITTIMDISTPKCHYAGCDNEQAEGSNYCYLHRPFTVSGSSKSSYSGYRSTTGKSTSSYGSSYGSGSSGSSSSGSSLSGGSGSYGSNSSGSSRKSSSSYNSYDDGYEDVYFDEDYDWDRYREDDDYAAVVDDAMEDEEW